MLWGSCSPSTRASSRSSRSETRETVPSPMLPTASTSPVGSSSMCSGSCPSRDGGRRLQRREVDHRDCVIGGVGHDHLAERRGDRDLMRHLAHPNTRDHHVGARVDDRHVGRRAVGHEHVVREVVQRVCTPGAVTASTASAPRPADNSLFMTSPPWVRAGRRPLRHRRHATERQNRNRDGQGSSARAETFAC